MVNVTLQSRLYQKHVKRPFLIALDIRAQSSGFAGLLRSWLITVTEFMLKVCKYVELCSYCMGMQAFSVAEILVSQTKTCPTRLE